MDCCCARLGSLSAVDVALTEAAIGSGVTGMLLARRRRAPARDRRLLRFSKPAAEARRPGILCAIISAGLAAVILDPPADGADACAGRDR